jgi:aconitate decarboxylase
VTEPSKKASAREWEASETLTEVALAPMPPDPGIVRAVLDLVKDSVGCGIFGSRMKWSRRLRASLDLLSEGGDVPVWGTRQRLTGRGSVLVNSTQVHSFEWDDQCLGAGLHAGSASVPTAFAVAHLAGGIDGRRLIEGVWAACEVGIRVGLLLGDAPGRRGFHIHGWTGSVASAAAAARMMGLSRERTTSALGSAASLGAGLQGAQYGADTKRLHAGRAAESGLLAAVLASQDFSGVSGFLERPHGGIVSSLTGSESPDKVVSGLARMGEGSLLSSVLAFKPVPCKIGVQAPYSLLSSLMRENRLERDEVEKIRVTVSPYVASSSGRTYELSESQTVVSAQGSIRYVLACVLRDGRITPSSFDQSSLNDESLRPYLRRIDVEADPAREGAAPEIRWGAEVEVKAADKVLSLDSSSGVTGFPGNDSTDWLEEKFLDACRPVLGMDKSRRLAESLDNLLELTNVRELGESTVP